MARMKGADLITEYLVDNKIPYVFGICGHGNVGMLDSLYESRDRIKLVSPRHEQVAAHMADAYFRVRHEPVATLTSCGPGSCNIVMPLQVALSDSSALLAITANVPTAAVQPHRRSRKSTSTSRPISRASCARWSSAHSSRRAWTCCRWRYARR